MPGTPAQVIWGQGMGCGMSRWRKPPGLWESAHPGALFPQEEHVVHQGGKRVREDQNQKAKPATRSQQAVSKRDEVVLSPKAQEFSQLLQKLKAMPEVREEKVAELTARIEAGEYVVDAKDIAEKMIGRTLVDRLR